VNTAPIITDADDLTPVAGAALVPTMGALHEGHLALIRCAAATGAPVIVSIFVNPTQFGDPADLARYPRTLDDDVRHATAHGATMIFAPSLRTVYPPDRMIPVPPLPAVAREPGLEDRFRPGHFSGVLQVVARLFDLVRPRFAVFGEKDYQQLLTIRALVHDDVDRERWGDLEIIAGPTVREPDGLAMSSRNRFLSADERVRATSLSAALIRVTSASTPDAAERVMRTVLEAAGIDIEYAVVRDSTTLLPIEHVSGSARALVAGRLGEVRLIDNGPIPKA